MATKQLTGAHERADHSVTRTPNWHYAHMRCAEQAARSISVQLSVREFLAAAPADEISAMKARRDSLYLLAAAHRQAGHRRERAEKFAESRPGTLLRVIGRGVRAVRSAVTA